MDGRLPCLCIRQQIMALDSQIHCNLYGTWSHCRNCSRQPTFAGGGASSVGSEPVPERQYCSRQGHFAPRKQVDGEAENPHPLMLHLVFVVVAVVVDVVVTVEPVVPPL